MIALLAYRAARDLVRRSGNRLLNRIDPPVLILLYHRVTALATDPQQLAVTPGNFRDQMGLIRDTFPLVGLGDDWSGLTGPAIAVTFDDGYSDNYHEALPILEEYGVPATVFVGTGSVGSREEFWWDELERLLLLPGDYPACFCLDDDGNSRSWPTVSPEDRAVLYHNLHRILKQTDTPLRQAMLRHLQDWSGKGREGRASHRPLNREELLRLAESPVISIGAHTATHPCLSALNSTRQREEITASKSGLEVILGREISLFSYPFGGPRDFNRVSTAICREAGFSRVTVNYPGLVHRWTEPLRLPRCLVRNWDKKAFAMNLERFLYL